MSIGEDVGADGDMFADGSFDRKASAINLRPHMLDDDAAARSSIVGPRDAGCSRI
jgi:hypothetical protein